MITRTKIVIAVFVLVLLYVFLRKHDKQVDRATASTALAPNVVEKIVINPTTHKLTIVKPTGVDTLFLPDRPSSIELNKHGDIVVTSKQYGTELRPFFGIQGSNAFRFAVGLDGLYYKRLDLGLGVAAPIGNHVPVGFVGLSYTVWSNVRAGITYDTSASYPGASLTVRF